MSTVFTVQSDSESECQRELDRLCRDFDLWPAAPPREWLGTGRWMARATPKAPAGSEGLG